MKLFHSNAARFWTLLAFIFLFCSLVSGQVGGSETQIANSIEDYIKPFVATGNFIGAVLVGRGGKVIFRHAYGMANYELGVPNTTETRFHIASVSKPFTAAAILQLQEDGKLSVSDHVSKYLPDFSGGDRITLDNLLTHTSGIPNVNDFPDYDTFARSPHTLEQLVAEFAGKPLEFEPGADYHYSNSNYNLLALIIEKVSGQSYGDYLQQHIFGPTGMTHSGNDGNARELIPLAASGYEPAGINGHENAPYLDWSNKTGNGSLYSTLDDLWRFDRALYSDTVLKAATRSKYFVEGKGNRYGWFNRKALGRRVMASNGRSPGFTAELDRFVDDNVTVIVLSNSYATVSQDPMAEGIAAIVFGQKPQLPSMEPAEISQSELEPLAGEYKFGADYFVPNAKVKVTAAKGYLLYEIDDFHTPLVPLRTGEFLERNFFAHVTFTKKAEGPATELIFYYGGRDLVAHRMTGE